MYLKTLVIKGFKSFAEKTVFEFEPGVTAVVGPNGSGKSNVVDALAWVMGEQGAKTLRGGKMEDVIFAGTASKGPLGRARVELTIDNTDGALPIEYTEVTIARTLFRNGGSEYEINGESCRLLDVQELLSDSGLGREMHVIVGQGQLDAVLRASAEDRRGFIEEAAGILKHRRRKERTERKLEAMEANFTRLTDLANELRRQLKPLGAQAEIARQAKEIQARVRDARSRLLADDLVTTRARLAELGQQQRDRTADRAALQEQLDGLRARQAELEAEQLGDRLDHARRIVYELQGVQEKVRGLYGVATQRVALLSTPVAATTEDPDELERRRLASEERERDARLEAEDAQRELDEASQRVAAKRDELEELDAYLSEQNTLVTAHELERQGILGRQGLVQQRLATIRESLARLEAASAAADERAAAAADALAAADADADAEPDDLEPEYREQTDRVARLEEALRAARSEANLAERERDAQAARAQALTQALTPDTRVADALALGVRGVSGLVRESLSVRAGYEAAVSAALGPLAEAIVVESLAAGMDLLAGIRDQGLSSVPVVVPAAAAAEAPQDVPGAVPLERVVEGPEAVVALLRGAYLAEEGADPIAAHQALSRALPRFVLVTPGGETLTRYVLTPAVADRSRLELAGQRDEALELEREAAARAERLQADVREREEGVAEAKRAAGDLLASIRRTQSERAERAERFGKLRTRAEATEAEAARLRDQAIQAREEAQEAQADAQRIAHELEAFDAQPAPLPPSVDRDEVVRAVESLRAVELEAKVRVATAQERARAERQRAEAFGHQVQQAREQIAAAARAEAVRQVRLRQAERVAAQLPLIEQHLAQSIADAQLEQQRQQDIRQRNNADLQRLRGELDRLTQRVTEATTGVHGLEMRAHELRIQLDGVLSRVRDELGVDEDTLVAEYGPDNAVPAAEGEPVPFDRAQQEKALAAAKRQLAQLGRVNPLALEEFAALEQRHTYLSEQLRDLKQARANLEQLIEELDDKMKDIFLDAYRDTRQAFHEVFPVLFPGGTGDLRLTDPDHPLTTGIDVSIRPAGKKIDRLSLLSGGERSLAAVALLVSIFKARPSPFYVMDEVEAALDDANLGRLLSIFAQLREGSQLIVITHQKRTMEIADALYGVSMRQNGISTVVGQRVRREEE